MNFNHTIKKIRLDKGLSQKYISNGVLSQSNYSKFENGQLDITSLSFIGILVNLNVDLDEFIYIHNGYTYSQKQTIFRDFFRAPVNEIEQLKKLKMQCENFLKFKEDQFISNIMKLCDAYINLNINGDIKFARIVAEDLVQDFMKKETLFINDIYLINSIFFVFEIETAHLTMKYIEATLKKYKDFQNINRIIVNLYSNYSLMLIKNKMFTEALIQIDQALSLAKSYKLSIHTAILYLRRGICLNNIYPDTENNYIQKGLDILEVLEEWSLLKLGKEEISNYCSFKL